MYYYFKIALIILFIIIIILPNISFGTISDVETENNTMKNTEGFGNYCPDCKGRTIGQCMRCFNCGFIGRNGVGQCVKGDMYGPEKRESDTEEKMWIYNDPFWTNVSVSDGLISPATYINNEIPLSSDDLVPPIVAVVGGKTNLTNYPDYVNYGYPDYWYPFTDYTNIKAGNIYKYKDL